jgi:hypothetical protein
MQNAVESSATGASPESSSVPAPRAREPSADPAKKPEEIGGPSGPEPTRYGDWEKNGRCIDF